MRISRAIVGPPWRCTPFERRDAIALSTQPLWARCRIFHRTLKGYEVRAGSGCRQPSRQLGPQWRVDLMPYGGLKESGFGKEGPRYAVEEMTELKMVVFHLNS